MESTLVSRFAAWQFRLPRDTTEKRAMLFFAFSLFVLFQAAFTVFVKITGDIYGPQYAFYDTQFMNIVYLVLCVPFWLFSVALQWERVKRWFPAWIQGIQFVFRGWNWFAKEQGLILFTSLMDAIAALLYGIGANGTPSNFQNLVSNGAPFLFQMIIYTAVAHQRTARLRLWNEFRAVFCGNIVGVLLLLVGMVVACSDLTGQYYTCSWMCYVIAAICTALSWTVKEYLFVNYQSNAIHVNTWNAFHMVWMTFPMFLLQAAVPWEGCQTTGTIAENLHIGWKCMRNSLSNTTMIANDFTYGCRDAGWTEWLYAVFTWLAGMAQFPLCQMTSSTVQFAATILTALLSSLCYYVFHGWGIHEDFSQTVLIGLVLVVLGSFPFYAAERDVKELQDDTMSEYTWILNVEEGKA